MCFAFSHLFVLDWFFEKQHHNGLQEQKYVSSWQFFKKWWLWIVLLYFRRKSEILEAVLQDALEWCCSLWRMSSPLTSGGNILNYSVDFLKRGPSDCCLTSSRIVTQNWSPFTGATKVKSWKWTHNIEG